MFFFSLSFYRSVLGTFILCFSLLLVHLCHLIVFLFPCLLVFIGLDSSSFVSCFPVVTFSSSVLQLSVSPPLCLDLLLSNYLYLLSDPRHILLSLIVSLSSLSYLFYYHLSVPPCYVITCLLGFINLSPFLSRLLSDQSSLFSLLFPIICFFFYNFIS